MQAFAFSFGCVCACVHVCARVRTFVRVYCIASSPFHPDIHSQLFLFFPPLLSLPLKPFSAIHQLSFGIRASPFVIVSSCLFRLHEDFKLAKMLACWAATCHRATTPLDADTDDCSEKRKKKEMVGGGCKTHSCQASFLQQRGKRTHKPVPLLPRWSSHCAGARLLLGDDGLPRPVIIELETAKK